MAIIVAATTMLTGRNKLAVENIPEGVEVADSGVEPVGRAVGRRSPIGALEDSHEARREKATEGS